MKKSSCRFRVSTKLCGPAARTCRRRRCFIVVGVKVRCTPKQAQGWHEVEKLGLNPAKLLEVYNHHVQDPVMKEDTRVTVTMVDSNSPSEVRSMRNRIWSDPQSWKFSCRRGLMVVRGPIMTLKLVIIIKRLRIANSHILRWSHRPLAQRKGPTLPRQSWWWEHSFGDTHGTDSDRNEWCPMAWMARNRNNGSVTVSPSTMGKFVAHVRA